jgi:HEAT repeat protein
MSMTVATLYAIQPPPGFNDKTVSELLPLLDSPNTEIRKNATAGISWQLEQNQITLTNIESGVVKATLSKTSALFKHEENQLVRLGCIAILFNLDTWTNTALALTETINDKDYLVRVRAITALIYVDERHKEQIPSIAISRLDECLKSSTDPEILWQAALAAGESREKEFLPSLQALLQNPSNKVRKYAYDAISKINR